MVIFLGDGKHGIVLPTLQWTRVEFVVAAAVPLICDDTNTQYFSCI